MSAKDPRVDAYIARQADFARPILEYLRKVIRAAGPDLVETIKWGHAFYVGRGPVCHMAAFKHHVALGFWKHRVVPASVAKPKEAMGVLGRITSVKDLPSARVLAGYVRQAMALDAAGPAAKAVGKAGSKPKPRPLPPMPTLFKTALARHPKARDYFASLAPSHRREYLEWIVGAKQDATKARRIATAIEWLSEGKHHNWRYEARSQAAKAAAPRRAARAAARGTARQMATRRTR